MIAEQISRETRLQVAAKWRKIVEDIRSERKEELNEQNQIRPSLIELTEVGTEAKLHEPIYNETMPLQARTEEEINVKKVESVKSNRAVYATNSGMWSTLNEIFTKELVRD